MIEVREKTVIRVVSFVLSFIGYLCGVWLCNLVSKVYPSFLAKLIPLGLAEGQNFQIPSLGAIFEFYFILICFIWCSRNSFLKELFS